MGDVLCLYFNTFETKVQKKKNQSRMLKTSLCIVRPLETAYKIVLLKNDISAKIST